MEALALALQILQGANLATPAVVAVFDAVRGGREAGKSDEEIKAEGMATALRVRDKATEQMGNQP